MGSFYELNDTLLLSADQGFPAHVFDYERHIKDPITLKDVEGKIFEFKELGAARAYQLDPTRCMFYQHTDDDKWLGWGHIAIQSLHIEHKPNPDSTQSSNPIETYEKNWVTSGTYKVIKVYNPEDQIVITKNEAPAAWNFFGDH